MDKNCSTGDLTNLLRQLPGAVRLWVNTTLTGQSNLLTFERNPYYWKVDNTGQQLLYIDYLRSQQAHRYSADLAGVQRRS